MLNRLRAQLLERIDQLSQAWRRFVGNHPRLIRTWKKADIALTWAALFLAIFCWIFIPTSRAVLVQLFWELLRPAAIPVPLPQQNPGLVPHRPVLRHRRLGDRPPIGPDRLERSQLGRRGSRSHHPR